MRGLIVVLAVAFAITMPILQALGYLGLPPAAFAQEGDETLRAASYAFGIWTPIYAGLIAFAIYQYWPKGPRGEAFHALVAPATIAIIGCGLWIIAAAQDIKLATVTIIVISAAAAITGLLKAARLPLAAGEWKWTILPISALGGWLTIASAINILTVATAYDWVTPDLAAPASAVGILLVLAIGAWVASRPKLATFGLPIAWGFIAVAVAMWSQRPAIAWLALAAAALILAAMALGYGRRNSGPSHA